MLNRGKRWNMRQKRKPFHLSPTSFIFPNHRATHAVSKGHDLPITVTVTVICICAVSLEVMWTQHAFSHRVLNGWLIQPGGGKDPHQQEGKEKEQRDIIGSEASTGGRHACSTGWLCVVSNSEVGGEEEQEEEEEEGVLPLQSGLSRWCIPAAPGLQQQDMV